MIWWEFAGGQMIIAGIIPQLVELVFSGIFLHFSGIQMFASKEEASWATTTYTQLLFANI